MLYKQLLIFIAALLLAPSPAAAEDVRHIKCLYQIVCGNFDVVLNIGQSNATSRGQSWRPPGLMASQSIYQFGRDGWDYQVLPAAEPLQHVIPDGVEMRVSGVGFALPFALRYEQYALEKDRQILIIPAAKGGVGAVAPGAYWRPDGPGFQDVVTRLNSALHEYRHSRLVAIIWHHGETDLAADPAIYRDTVVTLLTAIRDKYDPSGSVPIILGEMAPPLVRAVPAAARMNETIREISSLIPNSAIARADGLATNGDYNPEHFDKTHFRADAQIELGKRYFCGFERVRNPDSDLAKHPYCRRYSFADKPASSPIMTWFRGVISSATADE